MRNLVSWPPSWSALLLLPALFVGFTVHELAHAVVAYLLGDTSQVERKRLSFNPFRHVSWLGMAAFLLLGFGWAKPVWVDYRRFRIKNQAFGMFLVSIAGASANLLTALAAAVGMVVAVELVSGLAGVPMQRVFGLLQTLDPQPDALGLVMALTTYMVSVNLMLAFFNMLPLPPLDGFQALLSLYTVIRNMLKGQAADVPLPGLARRGGRDEAQPASPAQLHFAIGLEYHKAGQMDEAIARYRQALAQDGRFSLAYYNQGLAYWAKGRIPLAVSAFRAAMQAGDDADVRVQASLCLQELAQAGPDPEVIPGPIPPPLELEGAAGAEAVGLLPLDPEAARRVWLRLAIGGGVALSLAVILWLYVTAVLLISVGWSPGVVP